MTPPPTPHEVSNGIPSNTSSFIENSSLKDVEHVDLLPKMVNI